MNNDLISRAALIEEIKKAQISLESKDDITWERNKKYHSGLAWAHRMAIVAPDVDAERVKHGIWEEDPYVWRCSECHKWLMVEQGDSSMNFCTHCGARMDGRVET